MLTKDDAVARLDELRQSSRGARMYHDASWALSLAYAAGNHWSYIAQKPGLRREIKALAEVIDPSRTDCRVVLDKIGRIVRRTVASTKPHRLNAISVPASGSVESTLAKQMYDALLSKRYRQMGALEVWRSIQLPRAVLGSCGIRRQISQEGKAVMLPAGEDGLNPAAYRRLEVTWAKVLPWEILRDPAADDLDPNIDEVIFAQEKPRSVQWVLRNYGHVLDAGAKAALEQTETTMGNLLNYQNMLKSVTGWKVATHATDSKVKGVIVYEAYYQDADAGGSWPWQLIAFVDPNGPSGGSDLRPIFFGRDPFCSLPFSFIHYEKRVQGPWAVGIPLVMKQVQDIINLAMTTTIRVLIDFMPKWRIEQGTVDNLSEAISNRSDLPLVFSRTLPSQHIPDRVPHPGGNPVAENLLSGLGEEATAIGGLSPVQMGAMVKRGQSGSAYQTNVDQADVPLEDLRQDDEQVLNRLHYDTLIDTHQISLKFNPDMAHEMLDGEFPPDAVDRMLAEHPTKSIQAIITTPDSLRPKTASEITEQFTAAAQNQIVDPLQAQREMLVQGGVTMDSRMAEAVRKQELELEMILRGQQVRPVISEDHATAKWVLERFCSAAKWYALDEVQQEAVAEHWAMHRQAEMAIQMPQTANGTGAPSPGRPSPPAEPATVPAAPGPAGPAING